MGITVSHTAMLTHCHALTQACGYTEGEGRSSHMSHASRTSSVQSVYLERVEKPKPAAKEMTASLGMMWRPNGIAKLLVPYLSAVDTINQIHTKVFYLLFLLITGCCDKS